MGGARERHGFFRLRAPLTAEAVPPGIWGQYVVAGLDFTVESLIVEAIRAGVATRGALTLDGLSKMEWDDYVLALREAAEIGKGAVE